MNSAEVKIIFAYLRHLIASNSHCSESVMIFTNFITRQNALGSGLLTIVPKHFGVGESIK